MRDMTKPYIQACMIEHDCADETASSRKGLANTVQNSS